MEIICDRAGVSIQNATLGNPSADLITAITYGGLFGESRAQPADVEGTSGAAYCMTVISDDIGQLPLLLYLRTGKEEVEEDRSHPGGKVLRRPGNNMDAFRLRSALQNDALEHGNGRAYIARNGRGEPTELRYLDPQLTVTITLPGATPVDRVEKYHVAFDREMLNWISVPDADVLHIYRGGIDKYKGTPVYEQFASAFNLSSRSEKYASKFYENLGVPGLMLEAPPGAFKNEADAQNFINRWNAWHQGPDRAGKTGLATNGVTAKVMGGSLRDNQMTEGREFQVREMMRIFGVHMVPGVTDSSSYNTLEQHNRAYLLHGLGPWLAIWCGECFEKLLTEAEKRAERYYFEFDTWELVKPDGVQRAEMLTSLVRGMIITPNEARNWEGLEPMEGGDELINPAITPGGGDKPKKEGPAKAALRSLLVAESREVARMAPKARNFADWCDEFYKKHADKLAKTAGPLATHIIDCHRGELNDLASLQPADFAPAVASAVAQWPAEVDHWCEQMETA